MKVSRGRRKTPAFVKFLIALFSITAASFGIAFVWQNAQEATVAYGASSSAPDASLSATAVSSSREEKPAASASPAASAPSKPESTATSSSTASTSSGDESPEAPAHGFAREALEGSVPLSEPVDYSYFNDAIFFGDSISTGIPLYMQTTVPNAAVIAKQGVSTVGVNSPLQLVKDGPSATFLQFAKEKGERKKVYVMLGANGLDLEEKAFIDGYRIFVKSLKEAYPDAVIYIQSMLPVTANVNNVYKSANINNQRIAQYNEGILAMAREQGVYYVDVAQCMVSKGGLLPTEASPNDGMHLTPEYYVKWFEYLMSHTVSTEKKD